MRMIISPAPVAQLKNGTRNPFRFRCFTLIELLVI